MKIVYILMIGFLTSFSFCNASEDKVTPYRFHQNNLYIPGIIKLIAHEGEILTNPKAAYGYMQKAVSQQDNEAINFYAPYAACIFNVKHAAKKGQITIIQRLLPHLKIFDCPSLRADAELPYDDCSGIADAVMSDNWDAILNEVITFYTPLTTCNKYCKQDCQDRRRAFIAYGRACALETAIKEKRTAYANALLKHSAKPFITIQSVQYAEAKLKEELNTERKQQLDAQNGDYALFKKFGCLYPDQGYYSNIAYPVINGSLYGLFASKLCPRDYCSTPSFEDPALKEAFLAS